jgi:hypothetical protein
MKDTCGHTSLKQLASYDQTTSSWRTLEAISALDLKTFSRTLPKSGTTQRGKLYELVTLERPIKEQDYSLLLTPTASTGEFHHRVSLLPTPLTVDAHKGTPADLNRQSPNLRAMDVLPTPTVVHVRNHDEPVHVFMERQARSSTGQIGKSTGLAVRWIDKQFRIRWIKVD